MLLLLIACKNTPPSAVGIDLLPDEPVTADPLVVEVTTDPIDADEDDLSIEYRWSVDGEVQPDLDGTSVPAADTFKGESWMVEARAFDGEDHGPWTSDSVVIGNTGPSVVVQIKPSAPASTDVLTADVLAVDVDDDDLVLGYSWKHGTNELGTDSTLDPSFTRRGDVWELTVTADDGTEVAVATAEVDIENSRPTAQVTLLPEAPTTASVLTASISTRDEDNDPVGVSTRWFIDGAERAELEDSLTMPRSATSRDVTVTVEVTPNDGFVDGEAAEASIDILNTPPVYASVTLDPLPVYEGEVTCVGTYSDEDEDDEDDALVRWLVEGTEVSNDAVIDGSLFDKGDALQCGLTPYDGTDFGDEVLSDVATVQNSAPDVSSATLTIGPTDPQEADEVSYAFGGVTDADDDTWTEQPEWRVNGNAVSWDETLTGASFDKGESIQLVVTVDDGDGGTSEVTSNTLVASNTAPVLSALAFEDTLYTESEAAVTTTASDVDPADTVDFTYAWSVESVAVGTDETLDGSTWFDRDEVVSVTVTPTDGTDTGTAMTVTATVQNTPPTAPVLTIDPAVPDDGEALFCEVTTESQDDDGDDVTYTFAWEVDSSAFTAATTTDHTDDTVPEDETTASEEWVCTAVPTDDYGDDGPDAEDSVTIGNCWDEVYSASLSSAPSGVTSMSGGWGGHSYTTKDSVGCMWQSSDWNYSYIPVTRSSLDYELVEVDVYFSSTSSSHRSMTFYAWGDRYSYNWVQNALFFTNSLSQSWIHGGNTYASSTEYSNWSTSQVSTDTWVTLSFVVDYSTNTFDFYVDGTKKASSISISSSDVDGASVVLHSGGQAYTAGGNTCWANLAVYEADTDASCFN